MNVVYEEQHQKQKSKLDQDNKVINNKLVKHRDTFNPISTITKNTANSKSAAKYDTTNDNNDHCFQQCENIDEAMSALHTTVYLPDDGNDECQFDDDDKIAIPSFNTHESSVISTIISSTPSSVLLHESNHCYDWILDGDPINILKDECNDEVDDSYKNNNHNHNKNIHNSTQIIANGNELYHALEHMELECPPTNTPIRHSITTRSITASSKIQQAMTPDRNMDKHLILVNNEKLVLTPKTNNHTPIEIKYNENNTNAKAIGDFDCILDYLPSSNNKKFGMHRHHHHDESSSTPKTHSRCTDDAFGDDYDDEDGIHHILDHLPFEDALTPEGKFFRNLQVEREVQKSSLLLTGGTANEMNEELMLSNRIKEILSSGYDTPDFDAMHELFQLIPWDASYYLDDSEDSLFDRQNNVTDFPLIQIDNFLTEKLSYFDEISQEVNHMLLHQINRKEEEMKERMDLVQTIDCDATNALTLAREADLYLRRARGRDKRIHSSRRNNGITGGLQIIEDANQREKFRSIDDILKSCEELFILENNIHSMLANLNSTTVAQKSDFVTTIHTMSSQLKEKVLHDERFVKLSCLNQLRQRVSHLAETFCKRLEIELVSFISQRCASSHISPIEKWNDELIWEYKSLFKARETLQEWYELELYQNQQAIQEEGHNNDVQSISSSWCHAILKALCFEAEKSVASALLNPTSFDGTSIFESNGEFDQNLMEMREKLCLLQAFDQDAASLRSTTKNLLSIRFEFDGRNDLFPWVFHKFCCSLADLMHIYYFIMELHESGFADDNIQKKAICDSMRDERDHLWIHFKSLLVSLIESFIHLRDKIDHSSYHWAQEMESNHDILQLSRQVSYLAYLFTENENALYFRHDKCELKEILRIMFEKFVRCIHVDAMTEIGTMMASDTWELLPIPGKGHFNGDTATQQLQNYIQSFLLSTCISDSDSSTNQTRPWHNHIEISNSVVDFLDVFNKNGNPFVLKKMEAATVNSTTLKFQSDESQYRRELYEKLSSFISQSETKLCIGTQTAINGVGRWTIRLLTIRKKLPLVSDEIANVLRNIYDLYFLTVLRLCVGNAMSEDIVLGNTKRSDSHFNESFPQQLNPSSSQKQKIARKIQRNQSFGLRRSTTSEATRSTQKKNSEQGVLISKYCNADIYYPLKAEQEVLKNTQTFVRRAQASLSGKVDLKQVETWKLVASSTMTPIEAICTNLQKRVAASFSCLIVACLFDVAFHTAEFSSSEQHCKDKGNGPFRKYLDQMLNAVHYLHLVCLRQATIRAIDGRELVTKVRSYTLYV